METLKVSTRSNPNSVAGAMAGAVRQAGVVEVQVVGAGALNQAIKAVAIARGYVAASGIDLVCVPTFADIVIDGERRTAIRLSIEDRNGRRAEASASDFGPGYVDERPAAASAGVASDYAPNVAPRPPASPDGRPGAPSDASPPVGEWAAQAPTLPPPGTGPGNGQSESVARSPY